MKSEAEIRKILSDIDDWAAALIDHDPDEIVGIGMAATALAWVIGDESGAGFDGIMEAMRTRTAGEVAVEVTGFDEEAEREIASDRKLASDQPE